VKRALPIVGVFAAAIVLGCVVTVLLGADPTASSAPPSETDDSELLGGYGGLGSGAHGTTGPSADMPGIDAGLAAIDAGEFAPVPLAGPSGAGPSSTLARIPEPPRELPATVTFPEPRTVEDEYESANMVWSMIEARREQVRTDLAEARRTGDQAQSARLAHQLELLEMGDDRLEGIVREIDTRRAHPADDEAPDDEGAEPE
jgi:hypothetical protein